MSQASDLVQQGITALQSGDKQTARHYLGQAAHLTPNSQTVLLWFADTLEGHEQRDVLKRVVAINPESREGQIAARKLERMQGGTPLYPETEPQQQANMPMPVLMGVAAVAVVLVAVWFLMGGTSASPGNLTATTNAPAPTAMQPVVLTGDGAGVTEPQSFACSPCRLRAQHSGDGEFAVTMHLADDSAEWPLLLGTTETSEQQETIYPDGNAVFFSISAAGAWSLTIESIESGPELRSLSGTGDMVTHRFDATQRGPVPYVFRFGDGHFSVRLLCGADGTNVQQIINELTFTDTPAPVERIVNWPHGQPCFWRVQSSEDMEWSFAPK
jgi:hypothetical protein